MVPIFDYLVRSKKSKGIKAIIVYPMNALINSQHEEIENLKRQFEKNSGEQFPLTFARYTGQEKQAERERTREEFTGYYSNQLYDAGIDPYSTQ